MVFPGANALLELIQNLLRRPKPRATIPGQAERGDQPLPLVWLTGDPGKAQEFLGALARRLAREQPPRVVHTMVDVAPEPDGTPDAGEKQQDENPDQATSSPPPPLLPLLDKLRHELSADRFGSGRLTRFDHYRLVDMLTRQELGVSEHRDDRTRIVSMLRDWSRGTDPGTPLGDVSDDLPAGYARVGVRLVLMASAVFRFRWLRERVPGIRPEVAWLMRRQPYLVPKHSADFLGFAERLTIDRRDSESEEQLKKLLVHAFLEDLRVAYRRRRRRFFPHRSGSRRTTYIAAMLDNVTETNDGGALLQLVNEVRNETGELDPLLLIAASDQPPKSPAELPGETPTAANAGLALGQWRAKLPSQRQRLASDARYLVLRISGEHRGESFDEGSAWDSTDLFRPPPAPGWARRGVIEVVVLVALLATLTPPAVQAVEASSVDCLDMFSSGVSVTLAEIEPGDEQCIGYSDSKAQVFGITPRLQHVQEEIFGQNEEVEAMHEEDPDRPYLSIVYFGALTHRNANVDTDDALAEDLEGILLRQRAQNIKSRSEPLLRVIVANGGEEMKKADVVTRDMLTPLLAEDSTIMGVIGFDRTVTETEQSIKDMGALGVPTVGTPLTGSGLDGLSPLYFQVVPANAKQAELVGEYAKHIGAAHVILVHPPLTRRDTYVRTLDRELDRTLRGSGIEASELSWEQSPGDLDSLCSGAGHADDLVFYAGREEQFGDFMQSISEGCEIPEIPEIVGSDAISRFVAQRTSRDPSSLSGIKVSYVSMGSLVVLAGPRCVDGVPNMTEGGVELRAFCDGYKGLRAELRATLENEKDQPAAPWPGERVGLTYDASGMLARAVKTVVRQSKVAAPHRAAVAQELRESTFPGATGLIDFTRSRIGNDRNLAVLSIEDIHDMSSIPVCAYLLGDLYKTSQKRDENNCPYLTP